MNLNLTCQKTHILAWANSDETLSLKINGVKYLGFPKVDKRGGKYWKVDSLINSSEPKTVQETKPELNSLDLNKPLGEQTKEELAIWQAQQANQPTEKNSYTAEEYLAKLERERVQEAMEKQSQKVLTQTNHEPTN